MGWRTSLPQTPAKGPPASLGSFPHLEVIGVDQQQFWLVILSAGMRDVTFTSESQQKKKRKWGRELQGH